MKTNERHEIKWNESFETLQSILDRTPAAHEVQQFINNQIMHHFRIEEIGKEVESIQNAMQEPMTTYNELFANEVVNDLVFELEELFLDGIGCDSPETTLQFTSDGSMVAA